MRRPLAVNSLGQPLEVQPVKTFVLGKIWVLPSLYDHLTSGLGYCLTRVAATGEAEVSGATISAYG